MGPAQATDSMHSHSGFAHPTHPRCLKGDLERLYWLSRFPFPYNQLAGPLRPLHQPLNLAPVSRSGHPFHGQDTTLPFFLPDRQASHREIYHRSLVRDRRLEVERSLFLGLVARGTKPASINSSITCSVRFRVSLGNRLAQNMPKFFIYV